MVAAEAAACGSPPLVARHSGLAEVAAGRVEVRVVRRFPLAEAEEAHALSRTGRVAGKIVLLP